MNSHQNNVIYKSHFDNRKREEERKLVTHELNNSIPEKYLYDIRAYIVHCEKNDMNEYELNSLCDFLYISIKEERVKKTTWNKRLSAIKCYLEVTYEVEVDAIHQEQINGMRKIFTQEGNETLNRIEGKKAYPQEDILELILSLPLRFKAILYVNLITANRASEMVRIKVKDFDWDNSLIHIYLKKQKQWHTKKLTKECMDVVREYINHYKLKDDDYFVGTVNKYDNYTSKQISETGYWKMITKHTDGLTAYNFRKTQITSMHEKGADIATIARQTGHSTLKTISDHYLKVADKTVEKFL
ncbi:site-specific integrase [Lysinibacillus sp. 1P01SD]|uniref:tyrosine-type recombinase/integrase n=1 Tax=Lysinibacillus sp. 1P01SD TaxID=3132285 RepID=UPI0039A17DBA